MIVQAIQGNLGRLPFFEINFSKNLINRIIHAENAHLSCRFNDFQDVKWYNWNEKEGEYLDQKTETIC